MVKAMMRVAGTAAILALPILVTGTGGAAAQAGFSCNGVMFVNSIYTNGTGPNQFEYFIQVQNRSTQRRQVVITFGGLPADVTLANTRFRPTLNPYEQQTIQFGRGTTTNDLTLGRMTVLVDGQSGRAPWVRLSECIRGMQTN